MPFPRRAIVLLLAALFGLLSAAAYTLGLNPEVRFWRDATAIKRDLVRAAPPGPRTLLVGGSSAAFGLDPAPFEKSGGRAYNLAVGAAFGARYLTATALTEARAGDTVLLSIEPQLLTDKIPYPTLAVQIAWATRQRDLLGWGGTRRDVLSEILTLRPDGYNLPIMAAKVATGKPLYRYTRDMIQPNGFMAAPELPGVVPMTAEDFPISPAGWQTLRLASRLGGEKSVRVIYAMPWLLTRTDEAERTRQAHRAFLASVAEILPVLRDETLGVVTDSAFFADTAQHLRPAQARQRSESTAALLNAGRYWKVGELRPDGDAGEPVRGQP